MNDDEFNEILACTDQEVEIFKDMDIKRIRDQKNAWQLSGCHGPPPQPLIQLEELPEGYRNDDYFEAVALQEEELEGRGHRKRNIVSYNDGLVDDALGLLKRQEATSLSFRKVHQSNVRLMDFRARSTTLYQNSRRHNVALSHTVSNSDSGSDSSTYSMRSIDACCIASNK